MKQAYPIRYFNPINGETRFLDKDAGPDATRWLILWAEGTSISQDFRYRKDALRWLGSMGFKRVKLVSARLSGRSQNDPNQ